ncbi:MAG: C4-type zinc ribbon domain-containing protein [Deltaproteobacteria bacterium]|nr:C4-type zinc ribbon domain-containing protein [Deltaproteobacteria bacterium]
MRDEMAALEELQNLDLEILESRKELEGIPENLKGQRCDVGRVGEMLERERARLEEAIQWRTDREKEISNNGDLLGKSKGKLQGARNEKENKAAQREIDTIRKAISDREEEVIKIMEAIEQYRAAVEVHTKEFAELEEHLKASEAEGKKRMADLQAVVDATAARRKGLASRVPADMLRLYERIHKRLGRALVEAKDGKCTGCYMELMPQMYIEIQRGTRTFTCPSCFRILMFKESEPAESAT